MLTPGHNFIPKLKTVIITAVLLCVQFYAKAQVLSAVKYEAVDTTGHYLKDPHGLSPGFNINNIAAANMALKDHALEQDLQVKLSKSAERKLLMQRMKQLSIGTNLEANHSNKKLLYNLANAFARLKLYSLAMKCFFKTMQYNTHGVKPDTMSRPMADSINADTTDLDERYLNFNAKDDTLLAKQPRVLLPSDKEPRSPQISYQNIRDTFKDGKKAVAYAMLIHVKQPIAGKSKVYRFTYTGHTFITLIKYNSDSTYVSLSFGFYPDKNHPLAGSPLFPSSPSMYRDDSQHKWDEVAGKFISRRRFEKILALTQNYAGLKYHLSKNNCTDFSLNAALLADIKINGTEGKWPLGHGNNPGVTGQSMLQGKISNGNNPDLDDVFVDDTVGKP